MQCADTLFILLGHKCLLPEHVLPQQELQCMHVCNVTLQTLLKLIITQLMHVHLLVHDSYYSFLL